MKKRELGYNGWANYETWTIGLWGFVDAMANDAIDQGELQVDASWCQDYLEDRIEDDAPRDGILSDWVNASLGEVDFREIAEHVNDTILDIGL